MSRWDEIAALLQGALAKTANEELKRRERVPAGRDEWRFTVPVRWRYWGLRVGKYRWRFCYATVRNEAGFYLSWIVKPDKPQAGMIGFKLRKDAKAYAYQRYQMHKKGKGA